MVSRIKSSGKWLIECFIWAPSSEFVSSSIPSWQILTGHAQPFRGARDLAFCLKVPLVSLLVWASSGGLGETARMRRLPWTFAARISDNYQIRLTRPIYLMRIPSSPNATSRSLKACVTNYVENRKFPLINPTHYITVCYVLCHFCCRKSFFHVNQQKSTSEKSISRHEFQPVKQMLADDFFQSFNVFSFHTFIIIWATSWQNLLIQYANNKDADQPAHPRNPKTLTGLCSWAGQFVLLFLYGRKPRRQVFSWRGSYSN